MKIKKKLLSVIAVAAVALLSTSNVNAALVSYDATIPAKQGWWYSTDSNGSGKIASLAPTYALVYVESSTLSNITFYAGRAKTNTSNPAYTYNSSGTVITITSSHDPSASYKVYYPESYTAGTVGAGIKVRNHSYTLTKKGEAHGSTNYR